MIKKEVVVVGGGPAGLAAAIEAAKRGAQVLIIDSNHVAGGQLFKQIHKFFGSGKHRAGTRGMDIGTELLKEAESYGVEIMLNSSVIGIFEPMTVAAATGADNQGKITEVIEAEQIVIACGASENVVRFRGWTIPGVMGAGAAQTMINVNRVLPGEKVLMIGSGNVGLIVSYQLLQAGADVVALVEAAPAIGGYAVHASKLARVGVPILIAHTVFEVRGKERVEKAIVGQLDANWKPLPGTERVFEVDTVCIAAGLKPLVELSMMYGCELMFDPRLGGWAAVHNEKMETTKSGIYVAGDVSGVEEANTALEEGRLAGVSVAEARGLISAESAEKDRLEIWSRLDGLREGPKGEARRQVKKELIDRFSKLKREVK